MEKTVDKIDAAIEQLDWAIRLLIDYNAPLPSITLAGAAEEILGKPLSETAHEKICDELMREYGVGKRYLNNEYLNMVRNWLKHWDMGKESEAININLSSHAIQMIARALANLVSLQSRLSVQGQRFVDWVAYDSLSGTYNCLNNNSNGVDS